jgi:hypothetical protein
MGARIAGALARFLAQPVRRDATRNDVLAISARLRPGDVVLTEGNSRAAALVRFITRSPWAHVSMYVGALEDAADAPCVVEAHLVAGVRTIRLSELDATRVCVLRPTALDEAARSRLAQSVLRYVGSDYDVGHAWLLARRLLLNRCWARLRSMPTAMGRSATRFICSSLIAQGFALVGHPIVAAHGSNRDQDAHLGSLVPADFERASDFTIVWPHQGQRHSNR